MPSGCFNVAFQSSVSEIIRQSRNNDVQGTLLSTMTWAKNANTMAMTMTLKKSPKLLSEDSARGKVYKFMAIMMTLEKALARRVSTKKKMMMIIIIIITMTQENSLARRPDQMTPKTGKESEINRKAQLLLQWGCQL
jgi:hypothetical protein